MLIKDFKGVKKLNRGGDGIARGKDLKRVFFAVNSNEEISMKKTFLTCMAVVALFAIASGAGAITCTIDQRPAATLLVPYFQATFNTDGTPSKRARPLWTRS